MNKFIKISIIAIIYIVLTSFNSIDYNELLSQKVSFQITSIKLKRLIDEKIKEKDPVFVENEVFLLLVNQKNNYYEIYIGKTDFNVFDKYRPDTFKNFIGYTLYKGKPVLLFGDYPKKLIVSTNNVFCNFLGNVYDYDSDFPPIIYEPILIKYKINY
ncbi:hypothetical protein [Myroides odoratimimus]|uniref:hypothetical protein n=1 Tax=Myroides odoratimimus TaxID=76832 RepID=UPI003101416E